MRTRRLITGGTLAAMLVTVSLAIAQSRPPRGKGAAKPKPAPSAAPSASADNPYEGTPAPSASAVASAAPATSAAPSAEPPPPPPSDTLDGGGKLSPLNPEANEFSDAGVTAPSLDYDRLLADIGSLRARVAAVSDTLFHSRIAVAIEARGDHARTANLTVSLDDGVVWTSPAAFRADDPTVVYDHAVAPGHHAVGIDVERRDDRNDTFRSSQRSRFVVDVPADQKLTVQLELKDDSNMGGDFPADKKGRYDLRVRALARAEPIAR
jgi:hypothetical protein